MPTRHHLRARDETGLRQFAELVATFVQPGDLIALEGDLGAGKTTFARALIAKLLGDANEDIPSPTFTLVQTYETSRMPVAHLDLYRIRDAAEVDELGIDHALTRGIVLVEWPENGGDRLPADRIVIGLEEARTSHGDIDPDRRDISFHGLGTQAGRADRLHAITMILDEIGWNMPEASIDYLQGDASARRYARVSVPSRGPLVLMDWPRQPDGPPIADGLPYSRIAHLAEDVRPFIAVANALIAEGLAAPRIVAANIEQGLLVIDDLGDGVYGRALAGGRDQYELWHAAVDVLVRLRGLRADLPLPVDGGESWTLPHYDARAMAIEVSLLIDWLWPFARGSAPPADIRAEYTSLWQDVIARLTGDADHGDTSHPARRDHGIVLRDYHSPNLIWRSGEQGLARVGIIDFQDAVQGPFAYDLVSLLQDARLDVSADLERSLLDDYCAAVRASDANFDTRSFRLDYAALGAQRNSKILGIFARLAVRDHKPHYLVHMPRVRRYLERNLAHPDLAPLAAFHRRHLDDIGRG